MNAKLQIQELVVAVFVSALLFGVGHSQGKTPNVRTPFPPVPILGTELRSITSSVVGQEYDLYINLPRGYQDTSKRFPVLYLLDGQWDFQLASALFGEQYYDGFVPEIIIVGITWGGMHPNYDSLRARDLTPTNIKQVPQSGNAPIFLLFMKKELIPFIEANYRTVTTDRTLMGSSLGGLFTLYALFRETELFNRYVLTSPSVGWDNQVLYAYEQEYAHRHAQLPVRVFIGVGALEGGGVMDCRKFVDQLKSRNYEGLDLTSIVIDGIGHSGGKAEGYSRGLQAVFARPYLMLATDILEQYTGKYQLAPEMTIEISRESGSLFLNAPGGTKVPLYAETEKDFFVKGAFLFLHFMKNNAGKVTGIRVEQFAGEQFVQKVD
jgi:predicted alpha/beta superfamily hydrolase